MSLDYETYPLKELNEGASVFSGFAFKSKDFSDKGIPIVKIKNIQNKSVDLKEVQYFPLDKVNNKHKKFFLKNNDVLIAMTGQGSLGRVGRINLESNEYVLLNQRVGKFVVDEKNLHLNYLYHVISSDMYEKILFDRGTGSGQPNLSPEIILGTEIPMPNLTTQKKISSILDNINSKINLNKKINKNLTEISTRQFGHLMNNNIEEYLELKNICKFVKGRKPKEISEQYKSNFSNYLTIEVLSNQNHTYAYDEKGIIANEYDILMVMDGASSGKLFYGKQGLVGSTLAKIDVNNEYLEIIYQFLKFNEKYISDNTTGSAIPHTDKGLVLNLKCPISKKLLDYSEFFKSIRSSIILNNNEIIKLQKLRDTLLPKLMSGEIDVSKINCDLELKYNYMKYLFNQIHTPMSNSVV